MGGCQNYGPFLGTLNIRCRILIRTQKGTIILTIMQVADLWQGKSLEFLGPLAASGRIGGALTSRIKVLELLGFRGSGV